VQGWGGIGLSGHVGDGIGMCCCVRQETCDLRWGTDTLCMPCRAMQLLSSGLGWGARVVGHGRRATQAAMAHTIVQGYSLGQGTQAQGLVAVGLTSPLVCHTLACFGR